MFKTATVSCGVGIIISNAHLTSHIAHINKLCYVIDSDQPFLQELLVAQVYDQQGVANGWWGDYLTVNGQSSTGETPNSELKLARTLWAEAAYTRNRMASPRVSLFRKRRKRSGNETQNVSFHHRMGQRCKSVRLLLRHRRLL